MSYSYNSVRPYFQLPLHRSVLKTIHDAPRSEVSTRCRERKSVDVRTRERNWVDCHEIYS